VTLTSGWVKGQRHIILCYLLSSADTPDFIQIKKHAKAAYRAM